MSSNSPDLIEDNKRNYENNNINVINTVLTHSVPLWNLPCHRPRCLESILYLEMASIKYQRKICKYNINAFVEEFELVPMLRHKMETTRNIIDFCEGIGNQQSHVFGKNNGLNSHLQFSQKADISALQSLIRDRLHLVYVSLVGNFLKFLILINLLK